MLLDEGEYVSAVVNRNIFLEICSDITTSCLQAAMTSNCVILIATLCPNGQQPPRTRLCPLLLTSSMTCYIMDERYIHFSLPLSSSRLIYSQRKTFPNVPIPNISEVSILCDRPDPQKHLSNPRIHTIIIGKLETGIQRHSRFELVPVLVADIAVDGPLRSEEPHKIREPALRTVARDSLPLY
jgi:hypothetical protein